VDEWSVSTPFDEDCHMTGRLRAPRMARIVAAGHARQRLRGVAGSPIRTIRERLNSDFESAFSPCRVASMVSNGPAETVTASLRTAVLLQRDLDGSVVDQDSLLTRPYPMV